LMIINEYLEHWYYIDYQQMLYSVNSPYYRQFLSSTVNRKYQKNLEKQGVTGPQTTENRTNVNPSSVGV
jgi:hypothetical protein